MKKEIKLKETYHLNLGSIPVSITTLEFTDNGVNCQYNNSTDNRVEELTYDLFEMNGFIKPLNRIEEIQKRIDKSDNVLFFNKQEYDSLKKITKTTKISDYEVLTDDGFVDIESLHETIPYEVYHLKLSDGKELKCADNHIVFIQEYSESTLEPIFLKETFVKDLPKHSFIMVSDDEGNLTECEVLEVTNLGYKEVMYDLELVEGSNRRYYTNGILSHNTHLAKSIAELLFGDPEKIIRVDMSEFMEKHNVSKLIGSPPGYVGYDEGGQLTEKVKNNPFSVILFDEIEKAHKDVFNLLLQILDEGHLTDSFGRKVNFTNTIIIMTSNVGAKRVSEFGGGVGFLTQSSDEQRSEVKKSIIQKSLKQQFNPEFLNRIDDIILFNSLNEETLKKIINIEMFKLNKRLLNKGYKVNFNDSVINRVFELNTQEEYGARPLKRIIQNLCEDFLSEEILKGNITENKEVTIEFNKGNLKISKKNNKYVTFY